ncbi:unnamed protein product [Ceutorhynchus assimilis]|uniref:Uncharacterized protein n=1 Tax=Ceutorhynchus assimilis TaxID=467358 RepID=A0A9N9MZJ2_9CUCU|nr:unnamed protein product [Ceutorhynchus assimilis]
MKYVAILVFALMAISSAYAGAIGLGCCGGAVLAAPAVGIRTVGVVGAPGLAVGGLGLGGLGHGRVLLG